MKPTSKHKTHFSQFVGVRFFRYTQRSMHRKHARGFTRCALEKNHTSHNKRGTHKSWTPREWNPQEWNSQRARGWNSQRVEHGGTRKNEIQLAGRFSKAKKNPLGGPKTWGFERKFLYRYTYHAVRIGLINWEYWCCIGLINCGPGGAGLPHCVTSDSVLGVHSMPALLYKRKKHNKI